MVREKDEAMTIFTFDELDIIEGVLLADARRIRETWPDHRGFKQRANTLDEIVAKLKIMKGEVEDVFADALKKLSLTPNDVIVIEMPHNDATPEDQVAIQFGLLNVIESSLRDAGLKNMAIVLPHGWELFIARVGAKPIDAEEANTCLSPGEFGDAVLHRLWTRAVVHPDYDKEEWLELERLVHAGIAAQKMERRKSK